MSDKMEKKEGFNGANLDAPIGDGIWKACPNFSPAAISDADYYYPHSVEGANGLILALTDSEGHAHLIAAAPELLAEVKEYIAELELEESRLLMAVKAADITNNSDGVGIHFPYASSPVGALDRTRRALRHARNLVQKAEGKASSPPAVELK
jgi:hypothetical protein